MSKKKKEEENKTKTCYNIAALPEMQTEYTEHVQNHFVLQRANIIRMPEGNIAISSVIIH